MFRLYVCLLRRPLGILNSARRMITVVAALIEQDGRLLVCQRRRTDAFPVKWEFPGGKIREGETPEGR